ncbi:MAG: glycoside hydrolase family 88 protein [Bacteroidota bacterium]
MRMQFPSLALILLAGSVGATNHRGDTFSPFADTDPGGPLSVPCASYHPGMMEHVHVGWTVSNDGYSFIGSLRPEDGFSAKLRARSVRRVMAGVADWEIAHHDTVIHHDLDWTNGALYAGMMAWARMAGDDKYLNWLRQIGTRNNWEPGPDIYNADDQCVSQMYLDMYRINGDRRIIAPTLARIDWVLAHPSTSTMMLDYNDHSTLERWSWCDALFMAPPVYARLASITGEKKYVDAMAKEYQATYDLLYDREEHLFYRDHRYFQQRESNGRKVFWARGNGWVMGGLVSLLKELPRDNGHRAFYLSLFREMAERVASLQSEDGYWHASLLDSESYPNPETSGTAFFCYALAYGINAGLLEREIYLPHVKRAWRGLVEAVDADGKLGWVQPIGADPKKVERSMTEVYGAGAFLLAGSEVIGLSE